MNKIILLCFLLTAGCVQTKLECNGSDWTLSRTAWLYPFEMGSLEFCPTNGTIHITSYKAEIGSATLENIAEKVAKGVVQGMR